MVSSYHSTESRYDPFDWLAAKKAQQEIDAACGNDAIKWRAEASKSYQDWELPPAGEQQNCGEE